MIKNSSLIRKYFIFVGLLMNIGVGGTLLFVLNHIYSSGLSLPLFSEKVASTLSIKQPNLYKISAHILNSLAYFETKNHYFRKVDLYLWTGKGARFNQSYTLSNSLSENIKNIEVSTTPELLMALKTIQAGQTIILSPGEYHINSSRVEIGQIGTEIQPIHVTALQLGSVKVFLKGEGFVINKPYWQFSNLHLIGNCKSHTQCEHAFHVVGKGQYAVLKNNIMQDFNAMIKVNGMGGSYPDHGLVTRNTFFNTAPRKTRNPVTPFDLMHGNDWKVSDNFIFDIQKSAGDKVSYAAFFKGGSERGIFERNLVMCAANLPDDYTAIGLSLGGGGSAKSSRRNQNSAEHIGGVIRNNIIMHCSNDVGIYVNRSRDSLISHNILHNTLGIDIRYPESNAKVTYNIISGRVKFRDNAKLIQRNNKVVSRDFITGADGLSDYFVAPDIGDFTWRNTSEARKWAVSMPKDAWPVEFDFCGVSPSKQYIGAYSKEGFCLEKLNIHHNGNKGLTR